MSFEQMIFVSYEYDINQAKYLSYCYLYVQFKNKTMSNNTTKLVGALLLGAAVGVAIGVLIAPDKGSETRKKLADGADDIKHDAEEEIKEVIDAIKKKVSEMEDTLSKGFDKAKEMVEEKAHQIKNNLS